MSSPPPPIDHASLMRLHVGALFISDETGRLRTVNEPGGGPAPRLFLGHTVDGLERRFRHDLEPSVVEDLRALTEKAAPDRLVEPESVELAPILRRLERDAPIRRIWAGPVFVFPDTVGRSPDAVAVTSEIASVLRPYLEDWIGDVRPGVPMRAVVQGGRAVSICCSVRVTPLAHEAGVETHPRFRGKGHAVVVVRAWAADVAAIGGIPLYSTSWENTASLSVAETLGLLRLGVDLHVT